MSEPAPTPPVRHDPGDPGRPLPQPADQPAHIESAHLFGAPLFGDAAPGWIMPVPVVAIGGVVVASAPDSSLTIPCVVDGISVTWGRQQLMDQPDPATATLTILDPGPSWALGAELRGQLVTISWQATRPTDQSVQTVALFVGRITAAKATRKTVTRSDGVKVSGLLVALSAASILADLANRIPTEDWPDETLDDRRARIAGYAANVCTGGVTVRGFWKAPHMAPVPLANQVSVLDHLLSLYESSGPDRMTFLPDTQQAIQVERRDYTHVQGMGSLHWNVAGEGTARDGKGAYIHPIAFDAVDGGMSQVHLYLDAARVEYADSAGLSKDITAMITRVEVSHPDAGADNATRVETSLVSTVDPAVDETTMGVRTARLTSNLNWNAYAEIAASDLAYMAGREGAGWRTDPITIRTKLGGVAGFECWEQMTALLRGGEITSAVFLQRSWFAQLGIRPVFGMIGGVISYRAGEWIADCELVPVNTAPAKQHAIAWEEIDDGSATYELQWWDEDNPRGLHESLTYEDIGFVTLGLNESTHLPDSGYDKEYP